jgi:hypothetical protein
MFTETKDKQPGNKSNMRWDRYIQAFNLIYSGQLSPTITDIKIITNDHWHQVFHFTFDDGAVLQFESIGLLPSQLYGGPPIKPYFQVVKPPDDNKDEFKAGEIYVLNLND